MDEIASSVVKAEALADVTLVGEDPVFSIPHHPGEAGSQYHDIVIHDVIIANPERDKPLARYDHLQIPGETVTVLKGASGEGKTTLIRGLTRYYPRVSGGITLFGRELDSYSQKELSEQLFYLPQQTFFFAGSIRENLAYGLDEPIMEEELLKVLDQACLLDMLREKLLKQSGVQGGGVLENHIGEGGAGLSGGERQRLSIARAFLRRPKLYIFDESTANLDAGTAEKVLDHIEAHAKAIHAGIVYISYDRNVMKRCGAVIPIENQIAASPQKRTA